VPVRDAQAVARAMERFLADPALADRMGLRSRQIAVERFDAHRVNRVLLEATGLLPASRG
jgi:glycosyltransferase involved in cell wall biosynthesis